MASAAVLWFGEIMSAVPLRNNKAAVADIRTVTVLGATGLGFSLLGSASASTVPAADIAQSDNTSPNQRFVLSEEEMADVSLATFHLLDKENVGSGVQLARGCGGCRGCGGGGFRGCGGCRGCAGCRACRCGVGCGGCGGGGCGVGWIGVPGIGIGIGCSGCCASWGRCRWC